MTMTAATAPAQDALQLYRILSVLLEYPSRELVRHRNEVFDAVHALQLDSEDRQDFDAFEEWVRRQSETDWQEHYVRTFDLSPDNALYLTHHLFEEQDRERGLTLVTLSQYFKAEGYEVAPGELPDYLPLILEYVSTLKDDRVARSFISQSAQALAVVADNLDAIDDPYAALLRIIRRRAEAEPPAGQSGGAEQAAA